MSSNFQCEYLGTRRSKFDGNCFPEMVNFCSLITTVLIGHCDNFIFSNFFLNFARLEHSALLLSYSGVVNQHDP